MKWYTLKILAYIVEYLGTLFGKPKWQRWIYALLYPLMLLWDDYDKWRKRRYYLININGQVINLEQILNKDFDLLQKRIYIEGFPGSYSGVYVALEQELIPYLAVPFNEEEESEINQAPYIGTEADIMYSISFIVNVPTELSNYESQITAIVNAFKLAGKQFEIKYF